ncbi:PEP-CTERM sorting domain-containing protein [Janthinobacterium fluminis]|uniref:PEP-CTERM sorting domain-containing protein n=1 Tax=Janthinobacterium fluminis TaxID=2987524 RepID=A0ABT5K492_9BURK|nr:PEP-CTERM sorting domain-containing protein [Janthinobacterium fluminis]MDC8759295.1 PEP-CTERM sorting domain-containing protein [Janthinobacterium fluminis]
MDMKMKNVVMATLFCAAITPAFATTISLTENFDNLNGWIKNSAPVAPGSGSHAHVFADPTGGTGNVLGFSNSTTRGDIFSAATYRLGYINFDYFGAKSLSNKGGGFIGVSSGFPGTYGAWLGAGQPGYGTLLVSDGSWHHYSLYFINSMTNGNPAHIMLQQYNTNTADQALFRNLRISDTPLAAVPEPETYAMLLAGLGVLGFSLRRKAKAKAEA